MATEAVKNTSCREGYIYIPAGNFSMGSENVRSNESPVHEVSISESMCWKKTEVTNAQYDELVRTTFPVFGLFFPSDILLTPSLEGFLGPNQPVVQVNWYHADRYCKSIGGRLPTEAEWEYVARGQSRDFGVNTEEIDYRNAVYRRSSTADVCSKAGYYVTWGGQEVCDMNGNVWEWVQDWYSESYYANSPENNPQGPENGISKGKRGGSWEDLNASDLRSTARNHDHPDNSFYKIGFRCVVAP